MTRPSLSAVCVPEAVLLVEWRFKHGVAETAKGNTRKLKTALYFSFKYIPLTDSSIQNSTFYFREKN
jgi:hypothetical protein